MDESHGKSHSLITFSNAYTTASSVQNRINATHASTREFRQTFNRVSILQHKKIPVSRDVNTRNVEDNYGHSW